MVLVCDLFAKFYPQLPYLLTVRIVVFKVDFMKKKILYLICICQRLIKLHLGTVSTPF